jgi:hypothetical protein
LSRRSSQLPADAPADRGARLSSASPYEDNVLPSEPLPLPVNNGEPVIKEESYRGRSEYLGGSVPFDENMVKPGHETTSPKTSAADLQMLRDQGAFELPPEYVQRELMASFNKYCLPWTPVIDLKWLDEGTPPSMLLLQSIFLAGSRVSKAHLDYASSEVFYRRAKLLFFFGGGNNSLISIVAACLLHWYNPVGPEDVSTDTSGFWIRTAGAMAFQIGLHKEPPPNAKDRGLRRRLWWSLVVCGFPQSTVDTSFKAETDEARFVIMSSQSELVDREQSTCETATCSLRHRTTSPLGTSRLSYSSHIVRYHATWVIQ